MNYCPSTAQHFATDTYFFENCLISLWILMITMRVQTQLRTQGVSLPELSCKKWAGQLEQQKRRRTNCSQILSWQSFCWSYFADTKYQFFFFILLEHKPHEDLMQLMAKVVRFPNQAGILSRGYSSPVYLVLLPYESCTLAENVHNAVIRLIFKGFFSFCYGYYSCKIWQ